MTIANPWLVGLKSSVPSMVTAASTVSSTLVPDPSTFTVCPAGILPERLLEPMTSNPPVPAESAIVAPPSTVTGLPAMAPLVWVKVPSSWVIDPVTVSVPAEWVKELLPVRVYPAPLDTVNVPELVVSVVES